MPFKGVFRTIAMVPILVPSLMAGFVYLFGNEGLLKDLLFGATIYGAGGIVAGCVSFAFPHAFLIISTALAVSTPGVPANGAFVNVQMPTTYGNVSTNFAWTGPRGRARRARAPAVAGAS